MITFDIDASGLIGKVVNDEDNRKIGKVVSFLIDSSAQVKEVLVESGNGRLVQYPVERLSISQDGISLTSHIDKRVKLLSERFPVISKKRKVLDTLHESKVIPAEIYGNLCKEFDKALEEMKNEAEKLLDETEKRRKVQEGHVKTLQLARTFLEIEHGIGSVNDESYKQSLSCILEEMKNASQGRLNFLKIRDKISSVLKCGEEVTPEPRARPTAEPKVEPKPELGAGLKLVIREERGGSSTGSKEEEQAVTVRMTQE